MHESIGAKLANEPHPVSNTRRVGAFGGLLNIICDRLLPFVSDDDDSGSSDWPPSWVHLLRMSSGDPVYFCLDRTVEETIGAISS